MASVEVKVKKLDAELARYKEQMSKLQNGPGKARIRDLSMHPLELNVPDSHTERHTTASSEDAETEENVRITDGTTHAADFQHGICRPGD
jgi:charged multivesicular body protein 5